MSDPIVTLPPNHWIIREFRAWELNQRNAGLWPADLTLWDAFAAGAQSIPGNPEKVAALEQQLREVQVDTRVLSLEKDIEELNELRIQDNALLEKTVSKLQALQVIVESMRAHTHR